MVMPARPSSFSFAQTGGERVVDVAAVADEDLHLGRARLALR
jgi:hypothetical protein